MNQQSSKYQQILLQYQQYFVPYLQISTQYQQPVIHYRQIPTPYQHFPEHLPK